MPSRTWKSVSFDMSIFISFVFICICHSIGCHSLISHFDRFPVVASQICLYTIFFYPLGEAETGYRTTTAAPCDSNYFISWVRWKRVTVLPQLHPVTQTILSLGWGGNGLPYYHSCTLWLNYSPQIKYPWILVKVWLCNLTVQDFQTSSSISHSLIW